MKNTSAKNVMPMIWCVLVGTMVGFGFGYHSGFDRGAEKAMAYADQQLKSLKRNMADE